MNDRLEFADCPRKLKSMWIGFLILAFVLFAFVMSVEISRAHHPAAPVVVPVAKALGLRHVGGGAAGAATGLFVVGVAAVIVYHELTRKRCNERNSTWVDNRHDIVRPYQQWTDPCKAKRGRPKPVSVRG